MQLTSLSLALTRAGFLSFSPASLFAAGEPGAWYDPSDFSTMFQDSAGTTPVTAVEQPVGLILDKSKGLVLGSELVTNANTSTAWITVGTNTVTQDGSAIRVTYVDSNAGALVFLTSGALSSNLTVGKWYKVTFEARVSSGGAVNISMTNGTTAWSYTLTTTYQTFTGYINFIAGTPYIGRVNDGSFGAGESYWVRNISVRELPGNHATQTTSTSRPVLQQDGNGKYYLRFDGVDDWLITPTITPGTDKAQVFAGVRKLSDAAQAVVTELSVSRTANAGAFTLTAPNTPGENFSWQARGSVDPAALVATPYSAPVTAVVSATSDISADSRVLRVNNAEFTSTADQGAGNYLAYPLYIGRRGGTTLPFNGHLYGLIVRFGANLPAGTIASTETWLNGKTGAY